MSEQEKTPEQPAAAPEQPGVQPTQEWTGSAQADSPAGPASADTPSSAWAPGGSGETGTGSVPTGAQTAGSASGASGYPGATGGAGGYPGATGGASSYSGAAGGANAHPGAQPWATNPQGAAPGYWPQNWPTPLGSSYGYYSAPGGSVPPSPFTPATTTVSWWKRPAVFVTSLVLAFLLGMGTFAGGSLLWSAFNPDQQVQTPSRSGTNPWSPGDRGQAPNQQQPDDQQNDQQQNDQGAQPSSATLPTEAQTKGVVLIEATSGSSVGAGTGMVLTADGKVLTNYHVVAGSEKVSVTLADTGDTYDATVVGFDQSRDVALLQLADASNLPTVAIDDDTLAVGDTVSAVGNAQGGGELVRADGQVTGTNQDLTVSSESPWGAEEDLSGLIQTDANAVPGDSGGPMFDSENEVTGMTTAGSVRQGDSYAIPIANALQVVQVIEAGKDDGTVRVGPAGYLGIVVADSGRGSQSSRVVTQVVDGSPADTAGIEVGSILRSVNGTKITSSTNLADVIRVLEPGQQVKVEWTTAAGDSKSADVTLGASPIN